MGRGQVTTMLLRWRAPFCERDKLDTKNLCEYETLKKKNQKRLGALTGSVSASHPCAGRHSRRFSIIISTPAQKNMRTLLVVGVLVLACAVGQSHATAGGGTDNAPWTPTEILALCDGTDNLPCEENIDPRSCEYA